MEDLTIIQRPRKILFIGFNYNSSYFLMGTDLGFQVHQTYPLALKFSRILNGGIGLVQNLNKSNIFCLVGGGKSPKYAPNKLLIWDDKKKKEIYEFRFNSFVLNCFIKLKYIFVICKDTINIISTQAMKTVEIILTIDNPNGIGTISSCIDKYIFCWPDLAKGKIAIKDFSELKSSSVTLSVTNQEHSIFKNKLSSFKAHESVISFLKINNDGTKLATSSVRGNIIRIFDTINGCVIQELKRGNGDAKIYSINFSYDNNFVGLTSDHGTAHIFVINKDIKEVSNVLARSSQIFKEEKEKEKIKKENEEKKNNKNNKNDFDIIEKNNDSDFDVLEDDKDSDNENNNKIIINNNVKENNKEEKKEENNDDNFVIVNEEMAKSDIIESNNYQNQKSIFSGVSKMMGFSNIFQSEWSFASFKIPAYKEQSYISFIEGDKNNNKIIVIDKMGNYRAAEINMNKEIKIIGNEYLI